MFLEFEQYDALDKGVGRRGSGEVYSLSPFFILGFLLFLSVEYMGQYVIGVGECWDSVGKNGDGTKDIFGVCQADRYK